MRKRGLIVATIALVIAALVFAAPKRGASGSAPPDPACMVSPNGVTPTGDLGFDGLWSEPADVPTYPPHEMFLLRDEIVPGGVGTDGGDRYYTSLGSVNYVESGNIAFIICSGTAYLPMDATPPPSLPNYPHPLPFGTPVPLGPGGIMFTDGASHYIFRNVGDDKAVLWRADMANLEPQATAPAGGGCGSGRCRGNP